MTTPSQRAADRIAEIAIPMPIGGTRLKMIPKFAAIIAEETGADKLAEAIEQLINRESWPLNSTPDSCQCARCAVQSALAKYRRSK